MLQLIIRGTAITFHKHWKLEFGKRLFYWWVSARSYLTNSLFIYLEATVWTYEFRSYGGEQYDRQEVP